MAEYIKALLIGDVIGQPGCRALFLNLKKIVKNTKAQVVIVNGENSSDGFGITPEIADQLFTLGVDVITTGNHVWQKREILPYMERNNKVLRPHNYPPGTQGKGYVTIKYKDTSISVINLQGRQSMSTVDCPFRIGRDLIKKLKQESKIILIDFHAEASMEKEALANYLDGSVSAVVGTHTHIQTADERILPKGTAYISDMGMTGPVDGVIGVTKNIAIQRSLTQMPIKMEVADTNAVIQGVLVSINTSTGNAESIERISELSNI